MKKAIRLLLLLFYVAVLVFSLWKLWEMYHNYQESKDRYSQLEQYASFAASEADELNIPEQVSESSTVPEDRDMPDLSAWPQVDFEELSRINSDIVGWIYIENTKVNYPVVQGSDNSYYLNRLFDGTINSAGSIFLDAGCKPDFSGQNSILYGHHMKDKSMFGSLTAYKSQSFYDKHPTALLVTPTACYKIQFFSGYVSDTWSNAWDLDFTEYEYISWLNDLKHRSCFQTDYTPEKEDRVVTLSTCTYEFDTAKFVLHGYISEVVEITPDN